MDLQQREDPAWRQIAPIALIFGALSFGTAFVPGYGYMADELYFLSCADRLAWGGPPRTETFFNVPPGDSKKPIHSPSGEKKGNRALSVPGRGVTSSRSSARR